MRIFISNQTLCTGKNLKIRLWLKWIGTLKVYFTKFIANASFVRDIFNEWLHLIPLELSSYTDMPIFSTISKVYLEMGKGRYTWGAGRLLEDWYLHIDTDGSDWQLQDFTSPQNHTPQENFYHCIFDALLKCADWKVCEVKKSIFFIWFRIKWRKFFSASSSFSLLVSLWMKLCSI